MSFEVALAHGSAPEPVHPRRRLHGARRDPTRRDFSTSFATQLQSAGATATLAARPSPPRPVRRSSTSSPARSASPSSPWLNDLLRIAQFRQATAGSGVGPWCAYFTSWAAREAGVLLGDNGQGFGRVDDVYAWRWKAGKAVLNTGGDVKPQPGDLIVWDEHIGVVESMSADGEINTIEGNSSDQVPRRFYAPGARPAIGYVRL